MRESKGRARGRATGRRYIRRARPATPKPRQMAGQRAAEGRMLTVTIRLPAHLSSLSLSLAGWLPTNQPACVATYLPTYLPTYCLSLCLLGLSVLAGHSLFSATVAAAAAAAAGPANCCGPATGTTHPPPSSPQLASTGGPACWGRRRSSRRRRRRPAGLGCRCVC